MASQQPLFTLRENNYICNVPLKLTIHADQVIDEEVDSIVILGYGRIETESGLVKSYTQGAAITTYPTDKHLNDDGTMDLVYNKDSIFCHGTTTVKESVFLEKYYSLCMSGKLLTCIPYKDHIVIRDNIIKHNGKINTAVINMDINHAYIMRDAKNPLNEYRLSKKGEYVCMNPRELVASTGGTYGSTTFEDKTLLDFINVTRKKSEEADSPLEKYMLL